MVKAFRNEAEFQRWVIGRFLGLRGHIADFSSVGGFVPDLSIAACGRDYWLELKYQHFQLLHSGYDDFKLDTLTRGQLHWLQERNRGNKFAMCGVLAYCSVTGDTDGFASEYVFFMTARRYMDRIWDKKVSAGGLLLSGHSERLDAIKTGADLRALIEASARDLPWVGHGEPQERLAAGTRRPTTRNDEPL